jgi:glycine/D-amino acid oxidase-like deaminating enzyme
MTTAVVVGAGIFGASTARELRRRSWDVTLVEQYTPGTVRSASGGDTRIIRFAHGEADWYSRLALRALDLWRELEDESGVRLFEPVGVAWFDTGTAGGGFVDHSEKALRRLGIRCERLDAGTAAELYPSFDADGVRSVLFEPTAGVLYARTATRELARGLRLETRRVDPADPPAADVVVWACGPWLASLFPGVVELRVSRRDVFFLGVDGSWAGAPAFCDYDAGYYGHGDLGGLGMKVAPDVGGDRVDPDTLERLPLPANEQLAREYAARRFPALAGAPLVGARVCQYSLTGDTHFIVARHPGNTSWWLVGGGSGHGFKHGPALAEYVADCIEGLREPEPFHTLGPREGQAGLRTGIVER